MTGQKKNKQTKIPHALLPLPLSGSKLGIFLLFKFFSFDYYMKCDQKIDT